MYRLMQQKSPYHIEITLIPSNILNSLLSFSFSQYTEIVLKLQTRLNDQRNSHLEVLISCWSSSSSIFSSSSCLWGDISSSSHSFSEESIVNGFVESQPFESLLKLKSLDRFQLFSYYWGGWTSFGIFTYLSKIVPATIPINNSPKKIEHTIVIDLFWSDWLFAHSTGLWACI